MYRFLINTMTMTTKREQKNVFFRKSKFSLHESVVALLRDLDEFEYADVEIHSKKDHTFIYAHRCILSMYSTKFKYMFAVPSRDRSYKVDISKDCLLLLKKLMYTGCVEVDDEHRPEFMRVLEEFSIENSIGKDLFIIWVEFNVVILQYLFLLKKIGQPKGTLALFHAQNPP